MLEPIIHALKDWASSIIHAIGYPGLLLLMLLDSANIPIPSEVTIPLGGMLSAEGKMNLHLAAMSASIGSTLGSMLNYWIGAKLGKPFALKYGKYVLLRPKEIEHGDQWFQKYGLACTLWGRFVPLMRTFISFPAGLYRANFKVFVLYAFIGSTGWSYIWTLLGYFLGANWSEVEKYLKYVDYVVLLGLLAFIGRFLYVRLRTGNGNSSANA